VGKEGLGSMTAGGGAPLIEWLGNASGGPDTLGGKAASLDRLARMGFRIPPGFCLTTTAFERQVSAVGADGIESAALDCELDRGLRAAVEELADETADARFAVRSSAVGEDSSAASYAGLHETELGVTPDGVDASVRRCWASLRSPQALAYRKFRGISMDGAAMAVVVQRLVPADAAAVAFTRHPVTGRDDQLVMTAVRGLGDAMVSGTVTPDTYVIDKATLATLEFTPGDGPLALDDGRLRELAELCLRVEAGFGQAVDIEAAVGGDTWYLLQARPITTR
jgi:phosphoenolpyruvate synthase/pyruvate phosphate dikinase